MSFYESITTNSFETLTVYNENVISQVHHSMMNGLQVVQSLLSIKAMESKGITVNDYLKKSQSLISVLAAAHQVVLNKKFFFTTDCNDYLKVLVNDLCHIHESESHIVIHINIRHVVLETQNAITIGFILNELVSNSLKHSFLYNINGTISIQLSKNKEEEYELLYEDDGIGYNESTTEKKLGMELVHLFTDKIKGKIEKEESEGTRYKITFRENF